MERKNTSVVRRTSLVGLAAWSGLLPRTGGPFQEARWASSPPVRVPAVSGVRSVIPLGRREVTVVEALPDGRLLGHQVLPVAVLDGPALVPPGRNRTSDTRFSVI